MADQTNHLRVRVRHDVTPNKTRVEVLDADDNVLGDLAATVGEIRWAKKPGDPLSILMLEVACERAGIDSMEVPGLTTRRPT